MFVFNLHGKNGKKKYQEKLNLLIILSFSLKLYIRTTTNYERKDELILW